jgi:hypothetical protein
MAWNDFNTNTPTTVKNVVVSYVVQPTGASGLRELHRLLCLNGVLRSDQVLVSSLSATPAASVACTTPCGGNPPPTGINVTLMVHDPRNKIPDYVLTLSGHRMQT